MDAVRKVALRVAVEWQACRRWYGGHAMLPADFISALDSLCDILVRDGLAASALEPHRRKKAAESKLQHFESAHPPLR